MDQLRQHAITLTGERVVRTIPNPDDPKSGFGYDLILTRKRYQKRQSTQQGRTF